MSKRRPEDYPQDHRIYTGLYTAKAFNILKDLLPSVVAEYDSVVPIRDVTGETVLVSKYSRWEDYGKTYGKNFKTCRDWMMFDLRESFRRAMGPVERPYFSSSATVERDVVCLFLLRGEAALNPDAKEVLKKLRGIPRDVITSELNVCLAEEEAKIEREYIDFMGALNKLDNFAAASTWFGSSYNMPKPTAAKGDGIVCPDFYPAEMMEKLLQAEAECVEAFNTFARSSSQYMAAQAKYRSVLMDARKLNTKIKNDRIKAVRKEFTNVKRTSK